DGEFIVDPNDLVLDLLGRARLYVIRDHRLTFKLSDAVGDKRMSCYWGAVRSYMPGWSRHDDPLDHPLLIADRLADPVMRGTWFGELGVFMGPLVRMPPSIDERRTAAPASATDGPQPADGASRKQAAPVSSAAHRPTTVKGVGTPAPSRSTDAPSDQTADPESGATAATVAAHVQTPDFAPLLQTLIGDVRNLGSLVRQLNDEVERLRTISSVRSSSTNAIERRLGRLEDILEHAIPHGSLAAERAAEVGDAEAGITAEDGRTLDDAGAPSLLEVVQDSAESHSDALLFLDSARESAAASPYEDPERVRAILEAMARVARRRRDGVLGTSLRDAFSDLGIDYRTGIARNTPARLREQYRFPYRGTELVEAEEHIALGNTYDPRRCLRVYFSSRVPNEPRLVVAHVGRHFEVKTST
ncbi:MAG: hypothetical protein ACRELX_15530, partial [Longimicrobiales bacterium]